MVASEKQRMCVPKGIHIQSFGTLCCLNKSESSHSCYSTLQCPPTKNKVQNGYMPCSRSHSQQWQSEAGTQLPWPWLFPTILYFFWGFPAGSDGNEAACNAGDQGSIPGSGRSPGEGNGYPLQYSYLENSMDRGTWQATVLWGPKESETTE